MKVNSLNVIVLFDGVCILCNTAVHLLNKNLDDKRYSFIPSQSSEGVKLISKHQLGNIANDSVVVIYDDKVIIKSKAIMILLKGMPLQWRFLRIFNFLPYQILDYFYDLIAKNRYLIFKRKNEGISCQHEVN